MPRCGSLNFACSSYGLIKHLKGLRMGGSSRAGERSGPLRWSGEGPVRVGPGWTHYLWVQNKHRGIPCQVSSQTHEDPFHHEFNKGSWAFPLNISFRF